MKMMRRSLGEVLNEWNEAHPDRRRVNCWTISTAGKPIGAWILNVEYIESPARQQPGVAEIADHHTRGYL